MTKFDKILLLISVFTLWINSFFNEQIQFYTGFSIIFLVGILHGSNDIILIKKTIENNSLSNSKLISYYIIIVSIGFIMFYFIPTIALLLFIFVSSYHFGEQHWNKFKLKYNIYIIIIFQIIYGFFIFLLLFNFHENEVKKIILSITKKNIDHLNFANLLMYTTIILCILSYLFYLKMKKFKKYILINLIYLVIFSLIFKTADLIWGFAIYFVIWHSIPSIKDQVNFIYGRISVENLKKYVLKALPFWLFSLFGILILFLLFRKETIFETIFFSSLAAITFPHVFIMTKLIKKKSE